MIAKLSSVEDVLVVGLREVPDSARCQPILQDAAGGRLWWARHSD